MTDFTFVHAADLHLGNPLAGLASRNAELARHFMIAGRQAFTALVDLAIENRTAFMVVAGDIYNGNWTDHAIDLFFAREIGRLDRANIPSLMFAAITMPKAFCENRSHYRPPSSISRAIGRRSIC